MKRFVVVLSVLVALSGQARGATDSDLESTVRRLLDSSLEVITGFDLNELSASGDAVAVAALRILDPKKSLTEQEISSLVSMISVSFSDVDLIENPSNRNPGVSLFFVTYLAEGKYSPSLKKRIATVTEQLMAVRSRVISSTPRPEPPRSTKTGTVHQ